MNKEPLISVVIPFYNASKTIIASIKSVVCQSYSNWELILLDDGSNDDTLSKIQSIKNNKIRIVSDGLNYGLAYRLNQMCELTNGEYITRMDADDLMHPDRLLKQVKYFKNNKKIDVLCTSAISIDCNHKILGSKGMNRLNMDAIEVFKKGSIIHPTVMARREWFLSHKYNLTFRKAQDRELWVRSLADTNFAKISEPLLYYTESSDFSSDKLLNSYIVEREILKLHGFKILGDFKCYSLLVRSYTKSIVVYILNKLNITNIILKNRSNKFSSNNKLIEYRCILDKILDTKLNDK